MEVLISTNKLDNSDKVLIFSSEPLDVYLTISIEETLTLGHLKLLCSTKQTKCLNLDSRKILIKFLEKLKMSATHLNFRYVYFQQQSQVG